MDTESREVKSQKLFPVSFLTGVMSYTLSYIFYDLIALGASEGIIHLHSSELEIGIFYISAMFLGFLGPWIVYAKNIRLSLLRKLAIGFTAFIFLIIELFFFGFSIFPIELLIPLLSPVFPLFLSLAVIPLSFWIGKSFPAKIAENSRINLMNLKKITVAVLGFWLFCCLFGLIGFFFFDFLISLVSGTALLSLTPFYAFLSTLNIWLITSIASKTVK